MRYYILSLLLYPIFIFSQPNTEIFVFEIDTNSTTIELKNGQNISNNDGYDNQPSFINNETITFASTRNNQTDIAIYNLRTTSLNYINNTPDGSEYSPLKIPNSKHISAVRLDTDGTQRLYAYNIYNGESKPLIKDLIVAYYTWFNANTMVSSVIENDSLNLYVTDIKTRKSKRYATNVGRSIHKIPNSELVSFISKEDEKWFIKSLNPLTGETKIIIETVSGFEDICWLADGHMLISMKNTIYKFHPKTDNHFSILKTFENHNFQNITRISTNKEGTKLALVSEASPEVIVQKQLDAYNTRDIDAFMATYSQDIKLYNFPETLRSEGQDAMRQSYTNYFSKTRDLHCEILERIIIGNKVIDHELITANGTTFKAVAVYEVENGRISKVTFIQ